MWLVLCTYSLLLFISLLFMDHFILRHQGWVCIKFVSSTTRFSNLLLFSRVAAVNRELHVASRGSIRRHDQMVSSLFGTREETGFEDRLKDSDGFFIHLLRLFHTVLVYAH
jgi:hypothetical protein